MELILLLCSSGVAGLFTYLYLDYLSVFETEKSETKRMFAVLFSLISIGIFILIKSLVDHCIKEEIMSIFISLVIYMIINKPLNKLAYLKLINNFREKMNEERNKNKQNSLIYDYAINSVLSRNDKVFYIECYKDEYIEKPSMYGIIENHQVDNNSDTHFVISTTRKFTDEELEKADNYLVYHKENSSNFYKLYSFKK
ncbi:hypothetical protein [Staphylococcus hominis]|uniref:hypothetical protein n=1 Tax=Staphylococcus hominis TaxID=1290 RepID=UPI00287B2209|nr:hypothetical protein [Staphylococcus hominis]MDS3897016.1 hypothetical protein [Staphylococcus hominis]